MGLTITGDPAADRVLDESPFALLSAMLLDQQFPMERAFAGPAILASRLGTDGLDPTTIAGYDPERFAELAAGPPAIHRFPRSMAGRIQQLAAFIVEHYAGDAARLWTDATTGVDLLRRAKALPGFGEQKARILVALLGKQCGIQPDGWREAAGPYGERDSTRSVADVVDAESLAKVRATKREAKRAARTGAE